jgi:hypothetical protein
MIIDFLNNMDIISAFVRFLRKVFFCGITFKDRIFHGGRNKKNCEGKRGENLVCSDTCSFFHKQGLKKIIRHSEVINKMGIPLSVL